MRIDDGLNLKARGAGGMRAQRDFLLRVLEENQEDFRRCLFEAAKEDPKFFLRIYADLSKVLVPRSQDVNVSLTLNQDFQELQAIAGGPSLGPNGIESMSGGELLLEDFE